MWLLVTWQAWPAYLIVPLCWWASRHWRRPWLRWFALVALVPWLVYPYPMLPEPTGPNHVGTRMNTPLGVQEFYPTDATGGPQSTYVVSQSGVIFRNFHRTPTHAQLDAPPSMRQAKHRAIIFSPGYGGSRSWYTHIATTLASYGHFVYVLDYGTEQPDNDPNRQNYMIRQQRVRVADIKRVLDHVAALPYINTIDAIGHSFGGASSMIVLREDPRLRSAINLDGTPYGNLPTTDIDKPTTLIQSDPTVNKHSPIFNENNAAYLKHSKGKHITLPATNHLSFTDLPYLLSLPIRWAVSANPFDVATLLL